MSRFGSISLSGEANKAAKDSISYHNKVLADLNYLFVRLKQPEGIVIFHLWGHFDRQISDASFKDMDDKSSLEAASEAAAKVNAILIAKGMLRPNQIHSGTNIISKKVYLYFVYNSFYFFSIKDN